MVSEESNIYRAFVCESDYDVKISRVLYYFKYDLRWGSTWRPFFRRVTWV